MKNFARILASVSLAATFSFAQYVEYEDNEPWPTSEDQESAQEESAATESEASEAEEATEAKAEKAAVKDTAQKAEEDDAVSRVLAQKRARDAARKEEERQKALRGESEMSAIDQTTQAPRTQRATAGIGIRADFNIANYWGSTELEDDIDEPTGMGFDVALTARFEILSVLLFVPEFHFEAYWLDHDEDGFTREFNQMNLSLPLMFRAVLLSRFYAEVGPQFSLNLTNDVTTGSTTLKVPGAEDIVVENTYQEEIEQTSFAFGVTLGLGFYIIPDRLSISARFYAGLTELYPDAKSQLIDLKGTKLNCIKFGLNFWIL